MAIVSARTVTELIIVSRWLFYILTAFSQFCLYDELNKRVLKLLEYVLRFSTLWVILYNNILVLLNKKVL